MKKTYIQPSVEAIEIHVNKMVMTSLVVNTSKETSVQLSREADFNDEEY